MGRQTKINRAQILLDLKADIPVKAIVSNHKTYHAVVKSIAKVNNIKIKH